MQLYDSANVYTPDYMIEPDQHIVVPERPPFIVDNLRITAEMAEAIPNRDGDSRLGEWDELGQVILKAVDSKGRSVETNADLLFPGDDYEADATYQALIAYLDVMNTEVIHSYSIDTYFVRAKLTQCLGYNIQAPARISEADFASYPIDSLRCWPSEKKWDGVSTVASLRAAGRFSDKNVARIAAQWAASLTSASNENQWIEELPFPLASILQLYKAAGRNEKKCCDALLYFFEGFAAFYAIILWSAISRDKDLVSHSLYPMDLGSREVRNPFAHSTFGSWVQLGGALASFGRKLLGNADGQAVLKAFGTENVTALNALFCSDIITTLQSANKLRNDSRHGGPTSEASDAQLHTALRKCLDDVRPILAVVWSEFALFKAGTNRYVGDGLFEFECERLMGPATPFKRIEVRVSNPAIISGAMFLCAMFESTPLELEPLLIMSASPESAENACYFYSKTDGGKLTFVSYHFENRSITTVNESRVKIALDNLQSATSARS